MVEDPRNCTTTGIESMTIFKSFTFSSSHQLPNTPLGHKCSRLHGHNYRLDVYVSGEVNEQTGWICDFGDVAKRLEPILQLLDHRHLNEIQGLENPTCENLARWIWTRTAKVLPHIQRIVIFETPRSGCEYSGE